MGLVRDHLRKQFLIETVIVQVCLKQVVDALRHTPNATKKTGQPAVSGIHMESFRSEVGIAKFPNCNREGLQVPVALRERFRPDHLCRSERESTGDNPAALRQN